MIGIYWNAQSIPADYNAAPFLDRLGAVVMLFAHRLKVIRVIEFYLIAFVRPDMIHHSSHDNPAHRIAVHAKRVTG